MLVSDIKQINRFILVKAIEQVQEVGLTSHAPLGSSGKTLIIFDRKKSKNDGRVSQISVRLYNHSTELLITNRHGSFLFYGKFDNDLGIQFIAQQFFLIIDSIGESLILGDKVKPVKPHSLWRVVKQWFAAR